MVDLISIPGIGKTSLELLEAAGFHNAEALAKAGVDELARELERANSILKISKRNPGQAAIGKWIAAARVSIGSTGRIRRPRHDAGQLRAKSRRWFRCCRRAVFAIPLPARTLVENQLGVADIPAAILLNRYSGDLDVKVEQRLPANRQAKSPAAPSSYVRMADNGNPRLEIDTSKMRSTETMGEPMLKSGRRPPLGRG